jgi:hypothetical protein
MATMESTATKEPTATRSSDPVVIGAGLLGGLIAGNLTQLTQAHTTVLAAALHDPDSYGVAVLVVAALLPMLVPALRRWAWFVAAAGTLVLVVDPSTVTRPGLPDAVFKGPFGIQTVIGAVAVGLILGAVLLSIGVGTVADRVATMAGFAIGLVAGASETIVAWVVPGLGQGYAYAFSLLLFLVIGFVVALRRPVLSISDSHARVPWSDLGVVVAVAALATFVAIYPRYAQPDPRNVHLTPGWWSPQLWWLSGGLIVLALLVLAIARAGTAGARWVVVGAALAASFPAFVELGPYGARDSAQGGVEALDLVVVTLAVGLGVLAVSLASRVPWDAIGLAALAVPLFALPRVVDQLFIGMSGRTALAGHYGAYVFGAAGFATAAALTRLARSAAQPDAGPGVWRGVGFGVAAAMLAAQAVFQPATAATTVHRHDVDLLSPWGWAAIGAVVIVALAFVPDRLLRKPAAPTG